MRSNNSFRDRLSTLEQAVEALLTCELTAISDIELSESTARLESRTRNLAGLTIRLTHERHRRNTPHPSALSGEPTTPELSGPTETDPCW
ncbi:hypothetical protein [Nocardia sp. NBC_01329]|uniref:hypothetical protein n=1 Tax=Nocardia sp. NBC_01329 TaxID=2903594 RepID=UPI002E0D136B|nr:hypothetical protein OG405_16875 [Nocardia sp. NBC_01329]